MKKIGYMPLNGGIMGQATGPQKDRLQPVYNRSFWFSANWATGNRTDHNWSQQATVFQLWSVVVQSSCQSLHQLPTGLQNTNLIREVALTSSSHNLAHVLVALLNEWTICLPIKLATGTQIVETTTLIDCGATGNFIDVGHLSKANFPLQCLPKPIRAYNVDGTTNVKGTIRWKTHTDILFPQSRENTDLMVLSLGRQQVI